VLADLDAFAAGTADALGPPGLPPPTAPIPPLLTDPAQEEF
jgi:hypothetical protein